MDYPNSIETEKELAIRLHQFFTSERIENLAREAKFIEPARLSLTLMIQNFMPAGFQKTKTGRCEGLCAGDWGRKGSGD